MSKFTQIEKSQKSFDVTKGPKGEDVVKLSKLQELASFQRVTVAVKAVRMDACMEVSGGKKSRTLLFVMAVVKYG